MNLFLALFARGPVSPWFFHPSNGQQVGAVFDQPQSAMTGHWGSSDPRSMVPAGLKMTHTENPCKAPRVVGALGKVTLASHKQACDHRNNVQVSDPSEVHRGEKERGAQPNPGAVGHGPPIARKRKEEGISRKEEHLCR